jgi:molybdate transport system ATP-binding protein
LTDVTKSRRAARKPVSRPLIALEHCSLILDEHVVLDDVNFELRAGERWALIGANGSGKTFLLKMLLGDVWPTPTGRERRVYALEGKASAEPAGSKELIAYVGPERQDKYVRYDWDLSVSDVVTTGLFHEDIPLTTPTRAQRATVARALKRFGLWRLRRRSILSLSYGQRRLTLIARALVGHPRVLLLDEVFNGLDHATRRKLRKLLESQTRGSGDTAWVLTTHRSKELPGKLTHVTHIEGGSLKSRGPLGSQSDLTPSLSTRRSAVHHAPVKRRRLAKSKAPLLRLAGVTLYRDYRPVLRDVNWTVRDGEHWAILGANGSGKSTLLNLLHGDMHPALGGVIERGGAPFGTRIEEWKRRVGYVAPELQADHYLATSIEEIVVSGHYASVGVNEPPTRADLAATTRWLKYFDLEHLRNRGPRQVSYGQMRLALIARAMVNSPDLLLLDEPCAGLDHATREHVLSMIDTLARAGTQVVMAVHDQEDIIPSIRHVLRIRRGRALGSEQ